MNSKQSNQFRASANGSAHWRPLADDPRPPVDEPPAVARSTTSARGVDIDAYVFRYSGRQRANILILVLGVVLGIGALVYLDRDRGPILVLAVALALGLVAAGGVSFLITGRAHDDYTRLSVSRTDVYHDPRPQPVADVRPVVPDADSDATIRRGRFALPLSTWLRLFKSASDNDGRLARDKVVSGRGLPRDLYHGDAWQSTLGELRRLGLIDDENCVTVTGWAFRDSLLSPFPDGGNLPSRSRLERTGTNERPRTAAGEGQI